MLILDYFNVEHFVYITVIIIQCRSNEWQIIITGGITAPNSPHKCIITIALCVRVCVCLFVSPSHKNL